MLWTIDLEISEYYKQYSSASHVLLVAAFVSMQRWILIPRNQHPLVDCQKVSQLCTQGNDVDMQGCVFWGLWNSKLTLNPFPFTKLWNLPKFTFLTDIIHLLKTHTFKLLLISRVFSETHKSCIVNRKHGQIWPTKNCISEVRFYFQHTDHMILYLQSSCILPIIQLRWAV